MAIAPREKAGNETPAAKENPPAPLFTNSLVVATSLALMPATNASKLPSRFISAKLSAASVAPSPEMEL
jgi:hypothetical protein